MAGTKTKRKIAATSKRGVRKDCLYLIDQTGRELYVVRMTGRGKMYLLTCWILPERI